MELRPTASCSLVLRVSIPNQVGMLGRVTSAIGEAGGDIGAVDILLDCRATEINEAMKRAAAHAIAGVVSPSELQEEYIIPSVFTKHVVERVPRAVARTARQTGLARRGRQPRAGWADGSA